MKKIKQRKYLVVTIIALAIIGGIYGVYKHKTANWKTSKEVDVPKFLDAIKKMESENPPRIKENATDEDIYNSPYVQHIRVAIDGYLNGTNNGVEEEDLQATSNEMRCGLDKYSKVAYRGKFVDITTWDNDYGVVQAFITLIDRPNEVF